MSARFPEGFHFGVSTAAHQIEGARNARGDSIWDQFSATEGKVWRGHTADVACDHVARYANDVKLLSALGVNTYRFSISWPRVLPDGVGVVNAAGLGFYERLVDALLAANIEPFVTLYHWDLPLALHQRGGWQNRDCAQWFADFAGVIASKLGDRVRYFITLNEPQCFVGLGYEKGEHAPGLQLPWRDVLQVAHHALLGHGLATRSVRAAAAARCQVGYAPVAVTQVPISEMDVDVQAARTGTFAVPQRSWWNSGWWTEPVFRGVYPEDGLRTFGADVPEFPASDLDVIRTDIDFLGANIYHATRVRADAEGNAVEVPEAPGNPLTCFDWPIVPEALYWGPKFFAERYGKPVWITENGVSVRDWVSLDGKVHDPSRIDFMTRYLRQLARAVAEGVDVRGYLHWSLLDNFEWAQGYKERFGLYFVDYVSQGRIAKDSAAFYADVIRTRGGNLG